MTHQESNRILEGNVAIAKFMGRQFWGRTIDKFGPGTFNEYPDMKYHKSWTWLMPIVEKIQSIENRRYTFSIDAWTIEIWDFKSFPERLVFSLDFTDQEPLIERYYEAVLRFVQHYTTKQSADE